MFRKADSLEVCGFLMKSLLKQRGHCRGFIVDKLQLGRDLGVLSELIAESVRGLVVAQGFSGVPGTLACVGLTCVWRPWATSGRKGKLLYGRNGK